MEGNNNHPVCLSVLRGSGQNTRITQTHSVDVLGVKVGVWSVPQADTEGETQKIDVLSFAVRWGLWKRLPS